MKNFVISICIIAMGLSLSAQEPNKKVTDSISGDEIILGEATREGLIKIGDWFNQGYTSYKPDSEVIKGLSAESKDLPQIFVVLGTWCGDSKEHVPHFYKVIDQIGYPADKIFMVAVDRAKKGGEFCLTDFDIQLVPTFIFTRKGEEIGRIIETPMTSIEQDMLDIILGSNNTSN